jgi:hypothetical protein
LTTAIGPVVAVRSSNHVSTVGAVDPAMDDLDLLGHGKHAAQASERFLDAVG